MEEASGGGSGAISKRRKGERKEGRKGEGIVTVEEVKNEV